MAYRNLRTKRGYNGHEVVSALQKEVRRSDPDAALYWAMELHRSGYSDWLWKRIRVISTEDCSPTAGIIADIDALYFRAKEFNRKKSDPILDRIFAMQAVLILVAAPKNRMADLVLYTHGSDHMPRREIPDYAFDEHTARGKRMGRGVVHFHEHAARLVDPDESAKSRGFEDMEDELAALQNRYRTMRLMQVDPEQKDDLPSNPWQTGDSSGGDNDGDGEDMPGIGSRILPGPAKEAS
jgi:replication-associated recombination protein RarA